MIDYFHFQFLHWFLVAEMAAIGLGLERDTFSDLLDNEPHLLAQTGSDLGKHNKVKKKLLKPQQKIEKNLLTVFF